MKTWDGQTPVNIPLADNHALGYDRGYRAAMNSPTVVAMYEALKAIPHSELLVAAYEAGLKDAP